METIYVCHCLINEANFDSFKESMNNDNLLIDKLLEYIEIKGLEIFERQNNVAVTENGWYGAFYNKDLKIVTDSKKIGDMIDLMSDIDDSIDSE